MVWRVDVVVVRISHDLRKDNLVFLWQIFEKRNTYIIRYDPFSQQQITVFFLDFLTLAAWKAFFNLFSLTKFRLLQCRFRTNFVVKSVFCRAACCNSWSWPRVPGRRKIWPLSWSSSTPPATPTSPLGMDQTTSGWANLFVFMSYGRVSLKPFFTVSGYMSFNSLFTVIVGNSVPDLYPLAISTGIWAFIFILAFCT